MQKMEDLLSTSSNLLTHFCNKSIKSDNRLSEYLTGLIAKQLALTYQLLPSLPVNCHLEKFQIDIHEFKPQDYQTSELTPLIKIYEIVNRNLSSFFKGFYLHGSMATHDYIPGWSDVDTLAILSSKTTQDPRALMQVREEILSIISLMIEICPLQHHGAMVITEQDLNLYTDSKLPVAVFENMKSLKKGKTVLQGQRQNLVPSLSSFVNVLEQLIHAGESETFETHAYEGEYLLPLYKNAENGMYQFKYFLEQFSLLPALYLSGIGRPCYKKLSFDRVRDIFSKEAMDWIDLISEIRQEWGTKEGYEYQPNSIPSWLQKKIPTNYFEKGARIAHALRKDLVQ